MNPLAFLLGQQSAVDMAAQPNEEVSDRRGMFGMKGTLRDVVGLLGDAFLVQAGKDPLYMPTRQQERFADAMAGSSRNPEAAYERGMGVDFGAAQDFYKDYQTQQAARVRNQIEQGTLDQRVAEDAMKMSSQMMAAAVATGDPAQIDRAKQGIAVLSQRTGIPVEQLMAGGDPAIVAGRAATSYQNLRLPQYERGLDQGEERLAIALRNAKTAEGRLAIAEQMLGLRRDSEAFKQTMSRLGYELDVKKEERLTREGKERGTRDNDTAPSGGGWKIRPRSQ